MKKVKLMVLTMLAVLVCSVQGLMAQSTIYVDVQEAATRLYSERSNLESSYETLKKNGQTTAYAQAKAKVEYFIVLADAIKTLNGDVETAVEQTVLPGTDNSLTAGIIFPKQDVYDFRDQVLALLKK
jgi:hypothetical protein